MGALFEGLNPQQIEAVRYLDGPALVVAGPGSGKTRVLTHRVAYLIQEHGIDPLSILAITFTNKAAGEMKERIKSLICHPELDSGSLPSQSPRFRIKSGMTNSQLPPIGTFHATCARILRRDGRAIGLDPSFTIFDESDSREAIKKVMKTLNMSTDKTNPGAVKGTISNAKNELVDAEEFRKCAYGFFQEQVVKIYPEYQKFLRENKALDFDDLLTETVRLFTSVPKILEKYQNQWRYLLVDEYQDTNRAQYILLKSLAKEHKNLFVVGDMSQSIYSFRGADYRNIIQFQKDYPQTAVYRLDQNYRSTQTVVKAAREVIGNNQTHIPLDLRTENETGEKIKVFQACDEEDEASYVLEQISDCHPELVSGSGSSGSESDRFRNKFGMTGYSNFAVLYRTNAQSRAIEEVFIRAGVPYRLVGGTKFYERREIKDVLAYLRLVQNPKDEVSQDRVLKIGKRRAGAFEELLQNSQTPSLLVIDLLNAILKQTGYLELLNDGSEEGQARIENVKELRSVASQFKTLTEFLENVALVQQEQLPNGIAVNDNKEAVTLMTLHAAKGLEFPTIFIVGLEEGLLPHSRSMLDAQELEEERRLFYVGMTRAMRRLHLCHASQRLYFGSRQRGTTSRFIAEIPKDLIEFSISRRTTESEPKLGEVNRFLDNLEEERLAF